MPLRGQVNTSHGPYLMVVGWCLHKSHKHKKYVLEVSTYFPPLRVHNFLALVATCYLTPTWQNSTPCNKVTANCACCVVMIPFHKNARSMLSSNLCPKTESCFSWNLLFGKALLISPTALLDAEKSKRLNLNYIVFFYYYYYFGIYF